MTLESEARMLAKKTKTDWETLPPWMQNLAKKAFRKDAHGRATVFVENALQSYGQEWRRMMRDRPLPPPDISDFHRETQQEIMQTTKKMFEDVISISGTMEKSYQDLMERFVKECPTDKSSLKEMRWNAQQAANIHYLQSFFNDG